VEHSIRLDTQCYTYKDFLVGLKSGHDDVDHPEEAKEGAWAGSTDISTSKFSSNNVSSNDKEGDADDGK